MPVSRRVAVIAIEGLDPETLTRYAAAGWLPEIAAALGRSREIRIRTHADLFLTSVWPCAVSGVAVENHGLHAFAPLRSGTLDPVEGDHFHSLEEAREDTERRMVLQALQRHSGKITAAAVDLCISRPTFYDLMEKLGIQKAEREKE